MQKSHADRQTEAKDVVSYKFAENYDALIQEVEIKDRILTCIYIEQHLSWNSPACINYNCTNASSESPLAAVSSV